MCTLPVSRLQWDLRASELRTMIDTSYATYQYHKIKYGGRYAGEISTQRTTSWPSYCGSEARREIDEMKQYQQQQERRDRMSQPFPSDHTSHPKNYELSHRDELILKSFTWTQHTQTQQTQPITTTTCHQEPHPVASAYIPSQATSYHTHTQHQHTQPHSSSLTTRENAIHDAYFHSKYDVQRVTTSRPSRIWSTIREKQHQQQQDIPPPVLFPYHVTVTKEPNRKEMRDDRHRQQQQQHQHIDSSSPLPSDDFSHLVSIHPSSPLSIHSFNSSIPIQQQQQQSSISSISSGSIFPSSSSSTSTSHLSSLMSLRSLDIST